MGEYPERDGLAAMHVAYLPPDKLIGLSKIPRIVDMFARRLQAQEPLTREMAEATAEETAQRIVGRPPRAGGVDCLRPVFLARILMAVGPKVTLS